MLCTWPSGIMMNLTERQRHLVEIHERRETGPEFGSKGDNLYP